MNEEKRSSKELKLSDCMKSPHLISMENVQECNPEWLVPKYIPKGHITLLAGDGGTGKSFIWCKIAAGVSSGRKCFLEQEENAPQKVLFFSSEDSLEYTLKARLKNAGANLENIFSLSLKDETFQDIKFNSSILKEIILESRPALVIFDPLQAFLPPDTQMGQRNAMRNCLNPLIAMGEKLGTTFLIIAHTNKRRGTYGRNRIADSADIWDIARSVMIAGTTQDKNIHYLSHEKSNYGELGKTSLFSIVDGAVKVEGYTDLRDADFVREKDDSFYQAPHRQEAENFIVEYLKEGKQRVTDLDSAAKASGISLGTLKRAKSNLRKSHILGIENEGYGKSKMYYAYLIDQKMT